MIYNNLCILNSFLCEFSKSVQDFLINLHRQIYSKKMVQPIVSQNESMRFYRMALKFANRIFCWKHKLGQEVNDVNYLMRKLIIYLCIFFFFLKQISDNRSFYNHCQKTKYLAINQITKYASYFHSFGVIRWFPNILD